MTTTNQYSTPRRLLRNISRFKLSWKLAQCRFPDHSRKHGNTNWINANDSAYDSLLRAFQAAKPEIAKLAHPQ
jgi:hypothetical protein